MKQTKEKPKDRTKRKTKHKLLKLLSAAVAILIVLVVLVPPVLISSEKCRQIVLTRINDSVDGKADFASLSMSWIEGLEVKDFSFNDAAGQTSINVKHITTKPHYGRLLLGGLSFGRTVIDQPKVKINLKDQKEKNYETPQQQTPTGEKSHTIGLPIKKIDLVVNDGNLKVTGRSGDSVELSQINSHVNFQPPGKQTNFDINIAVAGEDKQSKVHTTGRIRPQRHTGWSLKGTSGDLTVEVNDLDIDSLGPFFELAAVKIKAKGVVSANVKSEIKDGHVENLTAELTGRDLDITGGQLRTDKLKTDRLDVAVRLHREKELINIETLEAQSDWAVAKVSGTVPTTFKSLAEFVKVDSAYNLRGSLKCNLAAVLSQMPHTLGLKDQLKVTSGQLSGDIETSTKDGQRKTIGQISLTGLAGTVEGRSIAFSEPVLTQVEITSDKAGINFDKLNASAAFAKINCGGSSELLKYQASANLSALQSELGQFIDAGRYKMAGQLFSKGELSGNKDKVTIIGTSEIKDFHLSSTDGASASEPMTNISFSAAVEPAEKVVNVDLIEASAGFGQVNIKDAVIPLNEEHAEPMKLAVAAKVNLEKIVPFAALSPLLPEGIQLAGTADSKISIKGKKGNYRIVTDATNIKNLKVSSPQQRPFEQSQVSVIFDTEINSVDKTINVRKFELVSDQIKIHKGEFRKINEGDKTRLQGQLDYEYDWSAVTAAAAAYLPQGLKLQGQRTDTINFFSEYPIGHTDKLLANLNTAAKLGFEQAQYMGLNFAATEADIQIQKGLLKIAPFSTVVNNGQFTFAGQVDFNSRPALLKTPAPMQIVKDIQITDQTTKKLLMYLNPVFAGAVDVNGIANFNCEKLTIPVAEGGPNDIEVVGTISIDQLRLQASGLLETILLATSTSLGGQIVTIHPTKFVLKDGFLRYDDMQMDVGDNPINFKGAIALDKSLDMTVTLPYTTSGRTVRVGQADVGQRISLPLKGTIDKPELKLDVGKLLEEQLKEQLQEKLQEGLERLFK